MHSRQEVPADVIRLAGAQAGVISRAQALEFGLSDAVIRRLLGGGWWGTFESGLYLVPNGEPTWHARVWAGVLLGGPDARVAGLTAARLHGLSDADELPVKVLMPFGRKLADREWVSFRQERAGVRSISTRAEPPRTRIDDTVLDLCAVGSETDCVSWVTRAVQRRLTTPESLRAALARRRRQPHRKVLFDLVNDAASGVHSTLEHRYLHDVERAHGLPPAKRQRSGPGRIAFIDVSYEKYGVLVELDGRIGHVEEGRWRDRRRDNRHSVRGLLTLRFGWDEVTSEPCALALDVAEVLIGRGWRGYPDKCPHCL